ncbi:ABC transporter permease [Sanguibacter suarezii]|uniref:ABC transporter permease n=1 Tax=Sanguibacter suarezii TaxID=60921 RepID=UPI0009FC40D3|nr:ABC transporter permease [Sanguibacter suarezii]
MSDQQPVSMDEAPNPRTPDAKPEESGVGRAAQVLREVTTGSFGVTVLAFVLALVIGGILIIAVNEAVITAAGYIFSKPSDFFNAAWTAVSEAYSAMFRGAVFNYDATTAARALKPLTETMTVATPLIIAALGVAVGFRAGLFNIGAQGQVIMGAAIGGYVGFAWDLPVVLHLLLALLGGVLAGGVWAGIAGFLRARTGAHEVIVTIMLNYVALYLVAFLLTTSAFTREGSNQPKSPGVKSTAQLPALLGDQFRLNAGFLVAILAAIVVWWLMTRSTWGFRFRAVGSNPHAARTAGMAVSSSFVLVMVVSGALTGLAGAVQVLGTEKALTGGIAGSIGFDAITVALLGRSKPLGIFFAGLLYAGLNVGGRAMEGATGTPINIVLVIQSLVVLFIAAPPLVRAIFRLPAPNPALAKGVSA